MYVDDIPIFFGLCSRNLMTTSIEEICIFKNVKVTTIFHWTEIKIIIASFWGLKIIDGISGHFRTTNAVCIGSSDVNGATTMEFRTRSKDSIVASTFTTLMVESWAFFPLHVVNESLMPGQGAQMLEILAGNRRVGQSHGMRRVGKMEDIGGRTVKRHHSVRMRWSREDRTKIAGLPRALAIPHPIETNFSRFTAALPHRHKQTNVDTRTYTRAAGRMKFTMENIKKYHNVLLREDRGKIRQRIKMRFEVMVSAKYFPTIFF